MMRHLRTKLRVASAIAAVFVAGAAAQQPQPVKLDEAQTLGRSLFLQSCGECHLLPQIGAPRYAPQLSRASLGGDENAMRELIANGTQRMPGFKYNFTPTQIAAITSYLKTVPPQGNAAAGPRSNPSNSRDQD
jgi:mono/diheme cytochrome c family protein